MAVELALSLGLLFSRLRTATAILGLVFHWILGVAGYYGFSATMIMALSLFVTPWISRGQRWLWLRPLNRLALLSVVLGIPLAWWLFGATPYGVGKHLWRILPAVATAFFLVHRGNLGILPVRTSMRGDLAKFSLAMIVPLMLFANGLSPYLGYKTEYSFAMYSNLRTEGGQTNHLLINRPLSLANYQTDLVRVEAGSDPWLLHALGGRVVTRYELTSMLWSLVHDRGRSDIPVVVTDQHGTKTFATADREPELAVEPSFLESRLLRFRAIVPARKGECAH